MIHSKYAPKGSRSFGRRIPAKEAITPPTRRFRPAKIANNPGWTTPPGTKNPGSIGFPDTDRIMQSSERALQVDGDLQFGGVRNEFGNDIFQIDAQIQLTQQGEQRGKRHQRSAVEVDF